MKTTESSKKKAYKKPVVFKICKKEVFRGVDCYSGGSPPAGSCHRGYHD